MTEGLLSLKLMFQSMLDVVKEVANPIKEALDGASATKETLDGVSVSVDDGGDLVSGSMFDIEPHVMMESSERYGNWLLNRIQVLYHDHLEDKTQEEFQHWAHLCHAINIV